MREATSTLEKRQDKPVPKPKPAPQVKAIFDSTKNGTRGVHGIGCKN